MRKIMGAVVLAIVLAGCGGGVESGTVESGEPTREETAEPTPEAPPTPEHDGKAYARKVRKAIEANFMEGTIESQCDFQDMTWHCFFDSFESPMAGWIKINLSFPGDYSQFEVDEISEDARSHVFNLAGLEVTDLDTVFTYANGVDSGTTYRRDMPLLNR